METKINLQALKLIVTALIASLSLTTQSHAQAYCSDTYKVDCVIRPSNPSQSIDPNLVFKQGGLDRANEIEAMAKGETEAGIDCDECSTAKGDDGWELVDVNLYGPLDKMRGESRERDWSRVERAGGKFVAGGVGSATIMDLSDLNIKYSKL